MLAADVDSWDGWRGAHCSDASGGALVRPRHHRPSRAAYDAAMDARALEEAQEKRKDRLDDWVGAGAGWVCGGDRCRDCSPGGSPAAAAA